MSSSQKGHLYRKAYKELSKYTKEELVKFLEDRKPGYPEYYFQVAKDILSTK